MANCGALDCFFNSREVDKFCMGECTTIPTINSNGECSDYIVHDIEDYMALTLGRTPKDLRKRIVKGREDNTGDWCEEHNARFAKAQEKYNI